MQQKQREKLAGDRKYSMDLSKPLEPHIGEDGKVEIYQASHGGFHKLGKAADDHFEDGHIFGDPTHSTLFYGIVEQVRNNQIRCLLAGSLRCVKRLSRDRVLALFLVCIMEDKKLLNFPQY